MEFTFLFTFYAYLEGLICLNRSSQGSKKRSLKCKNVFLVFLLFGFRISALNAVIRALADPKKKEGHIPYRESKLTRILQVIIFIIILFNEIISWFVLLGSH